MILTAIAAATVEGGIGLKGGLPWPRLPKDMARFREATMGKPMILGRVTWESIGRPLPGRRMIVLSGQPQGSLGLPSDVLHALDVRQALDMASTLGEECMVAGGGQVYGQLLPRCKRLLLTVVRGRYDFDTTLGLGAEFVGGRSPDLEFWQRALRWQLGRPREDIEDNGVSLSFLALNNLDFR